VPARLTVIPVQTDLTDKQAGGNNLEKACSSPDAVSIENNHKIKV
jgi:hypothetical protein